MIRLGVIGGGINSAAGLAHINALRMSGKFSIVGGCYSRQGSVLFESGFKYSTPTFSTVDSMIADAEPDRIVVLTPTPDHYTSVMQCLDDGVPVLCEKALATTVEDANRMAGRSSGTGVPLCVVFNYAFYPAVQRLRELVRAEELGAISHIHVEMPQSGYLNAKPQQWRLSNEAIYHDLGVHLHHMIWFLTGEVPQSVHAVERNWSEVGVVDYVSAQITYESFQAQMWFSKVSAGCSNGLRVRVFGSEGSAEWYQREPDVVRFGNRNGSLMLFETDNPRFKRGHPTGFVEALSNLYEAWADNPRHQDLRPSVAIDGLRLMEAMQFSADSERRITL